MPLAAVLRKYASFVGPGIMVSVAYMDPGNYSTAVAAGAAYQYKLLLMVFLSNVFAIILQCLCIKLGSVTGLDLAEMCRKTLPSWLSLFLYVCAEFAIVATDLAEVIGTAIALNILFNIPLIAGTFITIIDVLCVLLAYHRDGSMRQTRVFELIVGVLVLATCVCFVVELFNCNFAPGAFKQIVKGYLPISDVFLKESNALFLSCGIIGSTVMPHSLFLGSSIVQTRLREFDVHTGRYAPPKPPVPPVPPVPGAARASVKSKFLALADAAELNQKYRPSHAAIQHCLNYSYVELILSLFIIAVFVNSAILIVAGSTLYGKSDAADADLLSIYSMLSHYISHGAGIVFALSMLFAGQSAGVVCTMAGQIISEGFIHWSFRPWIRRLVTRLIAIVPVGIFVGVLGRSGVATIMNISQVALSFILPFVSAPLIYFTCKKSYMTVNVDCDPAPAPDPAESVRSEISLVELSVPDMSQFPDPPRSPEITQSQEPCEPDIPGSSRLSESSAQLECSKAPEDTELSAISLRSSSTVQSESEDAPKTVTFENCWAMNIAAMGTWLLITFLNIYMIYLFAKGENTG